MAEKRIRDMAVGTEAREVRGSSLTDEDMENLMCMVGRVQFNTRTGLYMFFGEQPLRFFGDETIAGLFDKFLDDQKAER